MRFRRLGRTSRSARSSRWPSESTCGAAIWPGSPVVCGRPAGRAPEPWRPTPTTLGRTMFTHGRKSGCRLTLDYTYRDLRVAYLENDALRVGVLVDKGADVFELTYKPRDLDFMWHSPIPLRRPFVATSALPEGAFHDYFYGGWQEILPSAGWAEEPYLGTYQGLHGEASLLPFDARVLEDSRERVELELTVRTYRSPLRLVRRMSLRGEQPSLFIEERLENASNSQFAVMWGHPP